MTLQTPNTHVLVIGAGHGGAMLAATLRQFKFDGNITLVGDEPLLPYHRPPLSKAWLKGDPAAQDTTLRPSSFYESHAITLRLGVHATDIQPQEKSVRLSNGDVLPYDILVLATGARPRPLDLPGIQTANVLMLRNAADAQALRARLTQGGPLAIIGGGYIGLEVAASARSLGLPVTVLEREQHLLARVASPAISSHLAARHAHEGVRILTSASASAIEAGPDGLHRIHTHEGHLIEARTILVGIGALPNDDLARNAGLRCSNGIVVDHDCQTSDPAIFAIGDVAFQPLPLYAREGRLESVPNANEQARRVAASIAGHASPAPEVPWFWSDQYDIKLQMAGLTCDSDTMHIEGDPESGRFAVYHLRAGAVRAVEAVNSPADFVKAKRQILAGEPVPSA